MEERDAIGETSGHAQADETDAFLTTLIGSQRSLYAFIGTLLPGAADLEDVYQQTCLALWRERNT